MSDPLYELTDSVEDVCTELRSMESRIECGRCGSSSCRDHTGAFDREINRATDSASALECMLAQDEDRPLPIALATWRLLLTVPAFGPEVCDGDQDTISSIVDHVDSREHAMSVVWYMAHARRDRWDLRERAGMQWDHVEEIVRELSEGES